MCVTMCRAIFARRLPFATSASSCVSRMRTSASSAATKNAFSNTSANTARIFSAIEMAVFQFISQFYFAKHDFQNVLQCYDSNFLSVTRKNDRKPFPGALHPAQRDFQPRVLAEKQRGRHVPGNGLLQIQIVAEQQRADHEQSGDARTTVARFPN